MGDVIEFNRKRFFTLDEAADLLPVVVRITHQAHGKVKGLTTQLNYLQDKEKRSKIESQIFKIYQDWNGKVKKLGCQAQGMWLVDFDNGDGYYCWRHPEKNISFFHGYFAGFSGREKIN